MEKIYSKQALPVEPSAAYLSLLRPSLWLIYVAMFFSTQLLHGQTPVPMASQPGLSYTESFADIANWTNNFAAGIGANRWIGNAVGGSGTIPNGTNITTATTSFVTSTSTFYGSHRQRHGFGN